MIVCEGQTFFAGADITEFGKPPVMPMLPTVVDTIENCTKPVVAAIHGTALRRRARGRARLPLPGRRSRRRSSACPRSSSACFPAPAAPSGCRASPACSKALEMCATGNPIGAKEASRLRPRRPADRGRTRAACGRLCRGSARHPPDPEDRREREDKLAEARATRRCSTNSARPMPRKFRGFDAPEANIKAVEAAVAKPYAEGVIDERKLFMELMSGTQAQRPAIFLLRRAQGRQDRRPARGHASRATSSASA